MAWRRPMMVSLLTHICVTRLQWVNSFEIKTLLHGTTITFIAIWLAVSEWLNPLCTWLWFRKQFKFRTDIFCLLNRCYQTWSRKDINNLGWQNDEITWYFQYIAIHDNNNKISLVFAWWLPARWSLLLLWLPPANYWKMIFIKKNDEYICITAKVWYYVCHIVMFCIIYWK